MPYHYEPVIWSGTRPPPLVPLQLFVPPATITRGPFPNVEIGGRGGARLSDHTNEVFLFEILLSKFCPPSVDPSSPVAPPPSFSAGCHLGARQSLNFLRHPGQGSSHQRCTPWGGHGGEGDPQASLVNLFVPARPGQKVLTGCRGQTWTGGDMPWPGLCRGRHA